MLPVPQLDSITTERRVRKRTNAYLAISRSPEYNTVLRLWIVGRVTLLPPEPNPVDLTVSKRTWERAIQQWRSELQRIALHHSDADLPVYCPPRISRPARSLQV